MVNAAVKLCSAAVPVAVPVAVVLVPVGSVSDLFRCGRICVQRLLFHQFRINRFATGCLL